MNDFVNFTSLKIDNQLFDKLKTLDSRIIITKIRNTLDFYDKTKQFDEEMFTILFFSVQQLQYEDVVKCLANDLLMRQNSNEFQILRLKFLYESCEHIKKNKSQHLQKLQQEALFQVTSFDRFGQFGASVLLNFYSYKQKVPSITKFLQKHFKVIVKQEKVHNYLMITLVELSFKAEDCDQQISELLKESEDTYFATKYVLFLANQCLNFSANETTAVKQAMKIFTQLSAKWPNLFNQNLQPFLQFYSHANYILRNTVNMIITNILTEYLNPTKNQFDSQINEVHEKQRNFLILKLVTRILDQQAYSRANTLNMLKIVCSQNLIPTTMLLKLFPVVMPRVFDCTNLVRRAALSLIKQFIRYMRKIFVEGLEMEEFMSIQEIQDQKALFQYEIQKTNLALDQIQEEKKTILDPTDFNNLEMEEKLVRQSLRDKISMCEIFSQYNQSMELIQSLLPKLDELLGSKCITDISKTISLICFLFKQRIENSQIVFMKILTLATNPQIVGTIAKKFYSIFFQKEKELGTKVENLYHLYKYSSSEEQVFLETVIQEMIVSKMIDEKMITGVYALFRQSLKGQKKEEMEICSKLVRICFKNIPAQFKNIFNDLKNVLEGQKTQCNWVLVTEMAKLVKQIKQKDLIEQIFPVFAQILYFYFGTNNNSWFFACKEIVSILIESSSPETALEYMLKKFIFKLFCTNFDPHPFQQLKENFLEQESVFVFNDDMIKLSQLIFMAGQAALVISIYIEDVEMQMKNYKSKKENEEAEDDKIFGGTDLVFEGELSKLRNIQKKNVFSEELLEVFYPHVLQLLTKINEKTKITLLHKSAALYLTNLMWISEEFCAEHIEKVFKWTELKNLNFTFKSNLIFAIGDLLNKWPDIVIGYCRALFNNIEKESNAIKKCLIQMISYQILNDSLKIQKEFSAIALLISDEDEIIQQQAKLFFSLLFKKDSRKIINNIFSILTSLSNENQYLKYQNFIQFGVTYLDKASEQLTERLLKKMKENLNPYEVQNIAFTLTKLEMLETHGRIYFDCYSYFQDRLEDPQIKDYFFTIVQKLLKITTSNDNYQIIKEFAELLQKGETKRRFISSKFKNLKLASQLASQQSQPLSEEQQSDNSEP